MKLRRQGAGEGERDNEVVVAIDLGASKLRIGVFKRGVLSNLKVLDTPRGLSPDDFINRIIDEVKKSIDPYREVLKGIGIASIGPLDLRRGEVTGAPNMDPGRFKLRDPLGEAFNTRVIMANDCVAAVWGEYVLGGWNGFEDQAYVTLSTGIGVGVIVEGQLLLGRRGNAHELGHAVIDFDSELTCGCGGVGHWEALVGGRNIHRLAKHIAVSWKGMKTEAYRRAIEGDLDGPKLFAYARQNDVFAEKVVDLISRASAAGLATVIAAYDPEVIHLGGSVYLNNEDILMPRIRRYLKIYSVFDIPTLRRTTFGPLTPLYGAAALVYHVPQNLRKYMYIP